MKKITLLLMAVLAWVGSVSAQEAQSLLNFSWAHTVEGAANASNNVFEAQKAADGSYFVANKIGTKTGALTAKFDGTAIEGFEGGTYGTAAAGNLYLQKLNVDGSVAWSLYTTKCDVSSVNIAPTSDGGAVLVIKSRVNEIEADNAKVLTLVDADKNTVAVGDANTAIKTYYLTFVKVDAEGKCQWTRLVTKAAGNSKTDYITVNGCATGASDEIYVAGKLSGAIEVANAAEGTATLTPHNATSDFFLLKLDANGYYQNSLLPDENENVPSEADNIVYADGNVYLSGIVIGKGLYLADKEVVADETLKTPFLVSVKGDVLDVNYVNSFAPTANKAAKPAFVVQLKALNYIGGNLYLTGSVNGGLSADGVSVDTESTMLKGLVLKANAADGKVQGMGINDTAAKGISNYFGVYEGEATFYTFGYDMAKSKSAILFAFDGKSFEKRTEMEIANVAAGANCAPILVDGNSILMMTRGKAAPLTFLNTDVQLAGFSDWGSMYCLYTINDIPTGISSATVAANAHGKVDVYTVSGVRVKTNVATSDATKGLAKGMYVVGNKKVVIK